MTDFDMINELVEQWFMGGKLSIRGQQTTLLDKVVILENGKIFVMLHFEGFKPFYMREPNEMLNIKPEKAKHIFKIAILSQLEKV